MGTCISTTCGACCVRPQSVHPNKKKVDDMFVPMKIVMTNTEIMRVNGRHGVYIAEETYNQDKDERYVLVPTVNERELKPYYSKQQKYNTHLPPADTSEEVKGIEGVDAEELFKQDGGKNKTSTPLASSKNNVDSPSPSPASYLHNKAMSFMGRTFDEVLAEEARAAEYRRDSVHTKANSFMGHMIDEAVKDTTQAKKRNTTYNERQELYVMAPHELNNQKDEYLFYLHESDDEVAITAK